MQATIFPYSGSTNGLRQVASSSPQFQLCQPSFPPWSQVPLGSSTQIQLLALGNSTTLSLCSTRLCGHRGFLLLLISE